MMVLESALRWGVRWRQVGPRPIEHLMYEDRLPVIFRTRAEARSWIDRKYGYIRERKDLKSAPHFWRMPSPIRVKVTEV
jgi:hypothetical protein